MSASPPLVWALPDLALLACPMPVNHYDRSFYDEYWRVLIEVHVPKCRECGFAVLFSDEAVNWIAQHFPFTEVGKGSWIDDFQIDFFAFLQEIRAEWPDPGQVVPAHNPVLTLDPDILPTHIQPGLRDAWLDLIAWCVNHQYAETYIASAQGLHPSVTSVDALNLLGTPPHSVDLVRQKIEWDAILARLDPWVAARLPKGGARPYKPRQPWRAGQRFPWHAGQQGYIDENGRIWVWDKLHKNHWDVQYDPRRLGDYDRVDRDGALLDGHD